MRHRTERDHCEHFAGITQHIKVVEYEGGFFIGCLGSSISDDGLGLVCSAQRNFSDFEIYIESEQCFLLVEYIST